MAAVANFRSLEQVVLPTPFDRQREALAYLQRCVAARRACAVVTGRDPAQRSALLEEFTTTGRRAGRDHWTRIAIATDSVQSFLETLLAQLGYTLTDAESGDLHGLLTVFLRHESRQGRRLIITLDAAEEFGPRVLDFLDQLFRVRKAGDPAVTLVLAGAPDLDRVLDSPGMARLAAITRERFDLDNRGAWLAPGLPAAAQVSRPTLRSPVLHSFTVLLEGQVVQRLSVATGRLLVGRSRQSDLRLGGRFVSRHHALLLLAGASAFITDLRSTNGTRVNGRPVRQQLLQPGDVIDVGNFQVRYEPVAAGPTPVPAG